jgi:hypothetical protein
MRAAAKARRVSVGQDRVSPHFFVL